MPAILIIVIGVFIPMAVLAVYTFRPTVDQQILPEWTLSNYARLLEASVYGRMLIYSLFFAGLAAAISVIMTFPFAYFVATKVAPRRRFIWVALAAMQFFTSYLIRVFVWMNLLGDGGLLNEFLIGTGLISEPLWLFGANKAGIVITFVYLLAPLTFLTTYIALERCNPVLLEAAADMGAKSWQRLFRVTLPMARSGLLGGFVLGMIMILGDYITPQLIGGTEGYLYSNIIQLQFGSSVQWGMGATLALVLMVVVFALLLALRWISGGAPEVGTFTRSFNPSPAPALRTYAILFLVMLYLPIALLFILAFNDRPMIGFPFTGFTLQWFSAVFYDPLLIESMKNSLTVSAIAVGTSVVLGTLAAVYLARSKGPMRQTSLAIISIPVLLPPMLLGLAIIIGLNALGLSRGLWTIALGHTVLSLPIVTLLVMIRLEGLDRNLEDAAMDLGATPAMAFLRISVPQALPGIFAAALITLALSFDEFILTALVTGSESTLPLYIYGALRFGVTPSVVAVSVMLLTASFTLLLAGVLVANLGQRKGSPSAAAGLALST
ncbi:ABC transporter permease subunit [Paracoccus halophilus]|nr:ABC transporter permease subunit [Paracoccus halophilus]